jgi:hypothetical protein
MAAAPALPQIGMAPRRRPMGPWGLFSASKSCQAKSPPWFQPVPSFQTRSTWPRLLATATGCLRLPSPPGGLKTVWIQLPSAPFAVCEKTKANRYISFVYSPAPRRGAHEGVYSVDPASKVRNIGVTQSRPGSHADRWDRRCASHDDFT